MTPLRCDGCGYDSRVQRPYHAGNLAIILQTMAHCEMCSMLFDAIKFHHSGTGLSAVDTLDQLQPIPSDTNLPLEISWSTPGLEVAWSNSSWSLPGPKPPSFRLAFYTEAAPNGDPSIPTGLAIPPVFYSLRLGMDRVSLVLLSRTWVVSPNVFDGSWRKVKSWLHECTTGHSNCVGNECSQLPSRYLEIVPSETSNIGQSMLKLRENGSQTRGKFIALSHVWASSKPITTTRSNLDDRKRGIPHAGLPKTFRDAVLICMKLGIQYLWIDALCILQDDHEDWAAQSSNIADVYTRAFLTVAAHPTGDMRGGIDADADNGCHLFRPRYEATGEAPDGSPLKIYCRNTLNHKRWVAGPGEDEQGPHSYFNRAWCYQERLLSPRVLHFAGPELVYECVEKLECECGASMVVASGLNAVTYHQKLHLSQWPGFRPGFEGLALDRAPHSGPASQSAWLAFQSLVQNHCAMHLTRTTDCLAVLSSLASVFAPYLGGYHYGIWEYNSIQALKWRSYGVGKRHGDGSESDKIAPSWSWASRYGKVVHWSQTAIYPSLTDEKERKKYKFAQLVSITDRKVVLLASTLIPVTVSGEEDAGRWKIVCSREGYCRRHHMLFSLDAEEDKETLRRGSSRLYVLELSTVFNSSQRPYKGSDRYCTWAEALVVTPSTEPPGAYRRVGIVDAYERERLEGPSEEYTLV